MENGLACTPATQCGSLGSYTPPTAREQLNDQKKALTKQLKIVDDALEALDGNPELEQFLTVIGRAVRL